MSYYNALVVAHLYGCVLSSIGKGTGYKRSELSALSDGSTLVVGGKELEVCPRYCIYNNHVNE